MVDKSFFLLLITVFMTNAIYGLASPFLPTVLEEKDISSIWTGIIFASYAVASTIVSIITGTCLDKIGHKTVITMGAFLMCGSIVCFGFLEDFDQKAVLVTTAIVLRIG